MIIDIFNEIPWQAFQNLDFIKKLPLNEQKEKYDKYLSELSLAKDYQLNYQVKGPYPLTASSASGIACSAGMDVVFVIDYTASMSNAIDAVQTAVASIVNTIITESGNDYRLGLVLFDEYEGNGTITYGTNPLYTNLPASQRIISGPNSNPNTSHGVIQVLTAYEMMSSNNQSSFEDQLDELDGSLPLGRGAGAVTTGEPGDIALLEVIDNNFAGAFRSDVAKLIILFTDDEPGGYDGIANNPAIVTRLESLRDTCINENIQLITLSSLAILPNTSYRIISDNAAGIYDNSLAPSVAIQAIEDICTENA
jgi:hypothetical protein